MMAANEDDLLRRFQTSGTRDALRELLVAHQHRIFNACFQVLGRAEDAEDAAQEVLMKVAEGAKSARDADAFRGWIYRVALRTALDHWRRRAAIKNRETRAAMIRPSTPPLDDRERIALFEAMDGLDDRERSLLLEHYFEKVPLETLGARQGVSAVAVWKRIDRAREKLKRLLLAGGFAAASARIGDALESAIPATRSASLISEAVLVGALSGGAAMGASKSSAVAVAMIVGMVCLTGAIGLAVAVKSRSPKPATGAREDIPVAPITPVSPVAAIAVPKEAPTLEVDAGTSTTPLNATLERYKAWYREWKDAASKPPDPEDPGRVLRLQYEGFKRFPEAREQIFADVDTFLDFLRDPKHEELVGNLVHNLLGKNEQQGAGGSYSFPQKFGDFPAELMEGFFDLLRSATSARRGVLRLLGGVHDVPEKFDDLYEQLMYDPNPWIQYLALWSRWRQRPLELPVLEKILARYESATDANVRQVAINAISYSPRPETFNWMLDQLDSGRDPQSTQRIASAAATMAGKLSLDSSVMDRLVGSLATAFEKLTLEHDQNWLLWSALYLPPKDSVRVLEATAAKASTPKLKKAIQSTLAKAADGTPTWNDLQNHFWGLMKD